jgi:hypothetical protein
LSKLAWDFGNIKMSERTVIEFLSIFIDFPSEELIPVVLEGEEKPRAIQAKNVKKGDIVFNLGKVFSVNTFDKPVVFKYLVLEKEIKFWKRISLVLLVGLIISNVINFIIRYLEY